VSPDHAKRAQSSPKFSSEPLQAGERPEERLRLESVVRSADARLAIARTQHDRLKGLVETRAVSRAEFENVERNFLLAREDLKTAIQIAEMGTTARPEYIEVRQTEIRGLEGGILEAKLQVADSTLKAPFDGVVARCSVDKNQSTSPRQPIDQIRAVVELSVDVDVPEALLAPNLRNADLEGTTAEFSSAPGKQSPVKLGELAQVADPVTQTFRARFTLTTTREIKLLPGMSATVWLKYRPR